MVQVRSPMLVAVGMYLPLETTFAIFVGGLFRWLTDVIRERRGYNAAQKARVENAGILTASGLIAGEALTGLFVAAMRFFEKPLPVMFANPSSQLGMAVIAELGLILIGIPIRKAGSPDEPPPPTAIM
jgi:hypothetical protein